MTWRSFLFGASVSSEVSSELLTGLSAGLAEDDRTQGPVKRPMSPRPPEGVEGEGSPDRDLGSAWLCVVGALFRTHIGLRSSCPGFKVVLGLPAMAPASL